MLRSLSFILVLFTLGAVAEDAPEQLFQKGLSAYQNKQYSEARDHFQKLLDQARDENSTSVGVLHNLALSAFQLDQKAYALALWRKALATHPGYRPAQLGRDYIEGKMQMRPYERSGVALWIHRTVEALSLYELLWLTALTLAFTGWLSLTYWGQRRNALEAELPMPPFPVIAMTLGLLLCFCLGLAALKARDAMVARATVVGAKVSVRALPTDDGVGLFDVGPGWEVLVRRHQDGWTQVQSGDGGSGWVRDSEIFVTSGR